MTFQSGHDRPVARVERSSVSTGAHADPDSCAVRQDGSRVDLSGSCTLQLASLNVRTAGASELEATQEGIHVLRGEARFEVAPVPSGARPVRVRVGGGVIEVVGTKFVVTQGEREGSVDLSEGKIRFLGTGGPPVDIRPGERFRWSNVRNREPAADAPSGSTRSADGAIGGAKAAPSAAPQQWTRRAAAEIPAPESSSQALDNGGASTADGSAVPPASVENAIQRAIRLRGEGRYGEARSVLVELDTAGLDPHTAEVLSFEEGDLLEHYGRDSAICFRR